MSQEVIFITFNIIYLPITLCMVINRLYVRLRTRGRNRVELSDVLVLLAWFFNLVLTIDCVALYATGSLQILSLDIHGKLRSNDRKRNELLCKIAFISRPIYYIPLYFIKYAILSFLWEITPPILQRIRVAIQVARAFCVVGLIFTTASFIFSCRPINVWWTELFSYSRDFNPHCRIAAITLPTSIAMHVFTDLYIYIIPFFILSKIRRIISPSQRIATYGMFGAGFALAVIGVVTFLMPPTSLVMYWCALHEQFLAMVVACLPSLRITFKRMRADPAAERHRRNRPRSRNWTVKVWRGELTTREVGEADSRIEDPSSDEKVGKTSSVEEGSIV